jgi:1-acyl-sn-glycerol-3-phosphate acyltransferase
MPLSFSGEAGVVMLKEILYAYFENIKLNPLKTEDWKTGLFNLFGIELINMPDLEKENYIFASNHISDFDGLLLGLLSRKIRIVAKMGWVNNKELMEFFNLHYNIVGVYRDSDEQTSETREHNFKLFQSLTRYLKNKDGAQHLLIFPQGTISDINKNSKERVNAGFAKMAIATKTKVINVFSEYQKIGEKARIIFSDPYSITDRSLDYSQNWLNEVIALQNSLGTVRTPELSEKHAKNNNPSEPFF